MTTFVIHCLDSKDILSAEIVNDAGQLSRASKRPGPRRGRNPEDFLEHLQCKKRLRVCFARHTISANDVRHHRRAEQVLIPLIIRVRACTNTGAWKTNDWVERSFIK